MHSLNHFQISFINTHLHCTGLPTEDETVKTTYTDKYEDPRFDFFALGVVFK